MCTVPSYAHAWCPSTAGARIAACQPPDKASHASPHCCGGHRQAYGAGRQQVRTASPAAAPAEMNSRRSASLCSSAMLASRSCASPDASAASMLCSPFPEHVPRRHCQAKGAQTA